MIALAHKLRLADFFSLGFGTMVGVGWLVVMDDWLLRGGPMGVVLAFLIGGLVLLPIGIVYGHLVKALPDAAGEIAYTAAVFPQSVSFATGWTMLLAYYIVCPWEAVAIGRIAGYLFPALNSFELYRVAGRPVYLPHLVVGLGLTALITILNYRGIRLSATVQNWATFAVLALTIGFVSAGVSHGSPHNLQPLFSGSAVVSVILMLQVVPYFMTGFESIGKASEEASTEFQPRGFMLAILLAIIIGALFYATVTTAVAYVSPWPSLVHENFATAVAFERAMRSPWIVRVIMATALLSLVKIFNGNFVAASRLLFGLGRRGMAHRRLGYVHPINHTPSVSVVSLGIATALLMFTGQSLLVPITEVGSLAAPLGWMASCVAYLCMRPSRLGRAAAAIGIVVTVVMVLIKVLPQAPGHFTVYEWLALAVWTAIGALLRRRKGEAASAQESR
ncbi:MAG TPA: APC family permease [Candidatus Angelobacter sp.]|nr:APC family permease [Candidatus Angelobacter sp.]